MTIVGNTKFTIGKILSGHFWYTDFWFSDPHPPLFSNTPLGDPPAPQAAHNVLCVQEDTTNTPMISIGLAVQDIAPNMGPLEVLTEEYKHLMQMAVPKGTVYFWDNRKAKHRGGANVSDQKRCIFYFSLIPKGAPHPEGPTYSLRKSDESLHFFTL